MTGCPITDSPDSNTITLHHLQPISTLIKNNPNLERLEITGPYSTSEYFGTNNSYSLCDVFRSVCVDSSISPLQITELTLYNLEMNIWKEVIPHLKSLKSLDIAIPEAISKPSNFWSILHMAKIHLKKFVFQGAIDFTLLKYLRDSCSVLESLHLRQITTSSAHTDLNRLADIFYHLILPIPTLLELKIESDHEGKWCFGPHNADAIFKCPALQDLGITLSEDQLNESIALLTSYASSSPKFKSLTLSHPISRGIWQDPPGEAHFYRADMNIKVQTALEAHGMGHVSHSVPYNMLLCGRIVRSAISLTFRV
ncbi:hypothetical protein K435DRAFT_856962 [Dendrothele bispora CBS 962.96]|uniref:F-box domain-containing protein n=1 Tax=Dendrothele bispora (strain CBS 962.96) TaxID=1314807 RepID=A0A4S8M8F4_DENBC|nr:hypothetical protein K435DRAFT_856962 [Dendrothele bispora CBS 962.96]